MPTKAKGRTLAPSLRRANPGCVVGHGPADINDFDIIINATPLGTRDSDPLRFDAAGLRPDMAVIDIVLHATETALCRAARAAGCRVQDGTAMNWGQALHAYRFLGLDYSPEARPAPARASTPGPNRGDRPTYPSRSRHPWNSSPTFPAGLSLSEICRRRGLPKSAAHRILSGLVERGFVEQDASSEFYRYNAENDGDRVSVSGRAAGSPTFASPFSMRWR